MQRWSPDKLAELKHYLETKPPKTFTREDHYLMVEWLVQRYLPKDDQRSEAKYQAALAVLQGRVDKNLELLAIGEKLEPTQVEEDPDFAAWLKQHLSQKST
jgi:hypothetical protein